MREGVVGGFGRGGEVHWEDFGLDARVLVGNLGGHVVELGLRARDEQDIEAFGGELEGVFFADALRGAGHDGPGALAAIFGELVAVSLIWL